MSRNDVKFNRVTEIPQILFEDPDFLVVSKPAGWLSVPPREPKPEVPILSHWAPKQSSSGQALLIHRLDRFTSGVMIFAKTEEAQKLGNTWFEKKRVKKTYHFFAAPPPTRPALQINSEVDGKTALTLFEVIEKKSGLFYGKATPMTGRFHQVREHAANAGFPLLGDKAFHGLLKFTNSQGPLTAPRVCLHAYSLETPLGKFQCELPHDLNQFWKDLSS